MADEVESVDADIFGGRGNGTLHLCVVRTLGEWNDSAGDRYLKVDFNSRNWASIFFETLHCHPEWTPYVEGEDINDHTERNRQLFQQSIPDYPLLGRIFQMYEDYVFSPEELGGLREECLKVKAIVQSPAADLGLRKLIYACDEASKHGLHLVFSCD
jgi:hypothetical protein